MRGNVLTEKYLLDTSALYPLVLQLREEFLEYTAIFTVLEQAFYEVGNTILERISERQDLGPIVVAKLFQETLDNIYVLRIKDGPHEIMELSINEDLAFYDAAYLFATRRYRVKLVAEDSDLLKFPGSITIKQLIRELKK